MLLLILVFLLLSLSHWLLEPLVRAITPALSSVWLGWLALGVGLWALAGAASDEPPSDPKS